MNKLTSSERVLRDMELPWRMFLRHTEGNPPMGLHLASRPLVTWEQKLFAEYLLQTEIVSDCEDPQPSFICPKCKCHSPAFDGGDTIVQMNGMVHYTFWRCLNPDCKHWWMLEDGEE